MRGSLAVCIVVIASILPGLWGCGEKAADDRTHDEIPSGTTSVALGDSGFPVRSPPVPPSDADRPRPSTCSEYPNQAAAQQAAATRDLDGDGIYCEALRCPCAGSASRRPSSPDPPPRRSSCVRTKRIQPIGFNADRFPHIRAHAQAAIAKGWPSILVLNRAGADARRDRLLQGIEPRPGYDRDEYPPAVGRGQGGRLMRGTGPTGWQADVEYVPSSENRSHGSVLGIKLRRFCDGVRFRYVFY